MCCIAYYVDLIILASQCVVSHRNGRTPLPFSILHRVIPCRIVSQRTVPYACDCMLLKLLSFCRTPVQRAMYATVCRAGPRCCFYGMLLYAVVRFSCMCSYHLHDAVCYGALRHGLSRERERHVAGVHTYMYIYIYIHVYIYI